MPWCEPCRRYLTPNTLSADGTCPVCGGPIEAAPGIVPDDQPVVADARASDDRVPWHFWAVMILAVVYLGWRLVEGVALLF